MRLCKSSVAGCGLLVCFVVGSLGCNPSAKLPDYKTPALPPEQAVTIEGYAGTYVTMIDYTKAPGAFFRSQNFGGNKVVLTPGHHTITVVNETSNAVAVHSQMVRMEYDFVAGHVYEVGTENRWNPIKPQPVLKDKTLGETVLPR